MSDNPSKIIIRNKLTFSLGVGVAVGSVVALFLTYNQMEIMLIILTSLFGAILTFFSMSFFQKKTLRVITATNIVVESIRWFFIIILIYNALAILFLLLSPTTSFDSMFMAAIEGGLCLAVATVLFNTRKKGMVISKTVNGYNAANEQETKLKLFLAGITGILFGAFGIHDFILKRYRRAVTHIVLVLFAALLRKMYLEIELSTVILWISAVLIYVSALWGVLESLGIFNLLMIKNANTGKKTKALPVKTVLLYMVAAVAFYLIALFFLIKINYLDNLPTYYYFGFLPISSELIKALHELAYSIFAIAAGIPFLIIQSIAMIKAFKYKKLQTFSVCVSIILISLAILVVWWVFGEI